MSIPICGEASCLASPLRCRKDRHNQIVQRKHSLGKAATIERGATQTFLVKQRDKIWNIKEMEHWFFDHEVGTGFSADCIDFKARERDRSYLGAACEHVSSRPLHGNTFFDKSSHCIEKPDQKGCGTGHVIQLPLSILGCHITCNDTDSNTFIFFLYTIVSNFIVGVK